MAPIATLSTLPHNLSSFLKTVSCSALGSQTTKAYATIGASTALQFQLNFLSRNLQTQRPSTFLQKFWQGAQSSQTLVHTAGEAIDRRPGRQEEHALHVVQNNIIILLRKIDFASPGLN